VHESLSRIFRECRAITARRADVLCDMGLASLHVCLPSASLWIEVDAEQAIGGTEQIRVTEYRPGSYQQHRTCCAWEAVTLIEQLIDRSKK
jgi:hypothetical protein